MYTVTCRLCTDWLLPVGGSVSLCLAISGCNVLPVDNLPDFLEVVCLDIVVLQVVSVLPHIYTKQRHKALQAQTCLNTRNTWSLIIVGLELLPKPCTQLLFSAEQSQVNCRQEQMAMYAVTYLSGERILVGCCGNYKSLQFWAVPQPSPARTLQKQRWSMKSMFDEIPGKEQWWAAQLDLHCCSLRVEFLGKVFNWTKILLNCTLEFSWRWLKVLQCNNCSLSCQLQTKDTETNVKGICLPLVVSGFARRCCG